MSITQGYSRVHKAYVVTARVYGLVPMDVRVLVALAEREGVATSDQLEEDLHLGDGGSAVRRSLVNLRSTGLLCGGSVRGRRDKIQIRARGEEVVHVFRTQIGGENDGAE